MNKNFAILFSLVFLMCSCSKETQEVLDIGESKPIQASAYWELLCASINDIAVVGDYLLVFPTGKVDVALVIDRQTGEELGKWGQFGKGPGEFKQCHFWNGPSDTDDMWIFDVGYFKLRHYSTDPHDYTNIQLLEEIDFKLPSFVSEGCVLSNGYIAGIMSFSADGYTSPLVIMDKEKNIVQQVGLLPDSEHEKVKFVKNAKLVDYRTYGGWMASYGNHFVQSMSYYGYLAFFESDQDGHTKCVKEQFMEPVKYTEDNTLDIGNLKQGFVHAAMNKDYVFAGYCGLPYDEEFICETILVFNHKGKLLRNYHLDRRIGSFDVSPDGKTLYAEVSDPETGIVVYHLD